MEACKAKYPKARIIYSSIVNNATDDLAARAIEVNRRVHEYCNSDSSFSFISHKISVEHFVDHVHINNGSGTKIFVAQLTGAVRSGLRTQNYRQHHEPPGYQQHEQRPHQRQTNAYGNRHQTHNRDNRYGNINRQQPRHDNRPNKYQQQYNQAPHLMSQNNRTYSASRVNISRSTPNPESHRDSSVQNQDHTNQPVNRGLGHKLLNWLSHH